MGSPLLHLPAVALPNFKQKQLSNCRFKVHKFSIRKGLSPSAGDFVIEEDDVLLTFLKDRELNGDFIARVSDKLWMRKDVKIHNIEADLRDDANQMDEPNVDENPGGFLKLTTTNEWLLGENTAPMNKKNASQGEEGTVLSDSWYRKCMQRILFSSFLYAGIQVEAAVSYATGVLFSCLYLQLLYRYVDNLSREAVPLVFRQRKIKRIGIRSDDLADTFEKVVKGCTMVLSSPRLVIPAAIYGLWGLSQHFANDYFQLTPAMVGVFAYKAAALVQVYRDNEDLELIFPGNEDDPYY